MVSRFTSRQDSGQNITLPRVLVFKLNKRHMVGSDSYADPARVTLAVTVLRGGTNTDARHLFYYHYGFYLLDFYCAFTSEDHLQQTLSSLSSSELRHKFVS